MTGEPARGFARRFPQVATIARSAALFVGGEWTEAGLRAVYAVLIARLLDPADYGLWSYALAAAGFAMSLAAFGIDMLVPARIGRDGRAAAAFLRTSLALRLGLLAVAALGLGAYALLAEDRAGPERVALLLLLPTVIARGTCMWLRLMAIGFHQSQLAVTPAVLLRITEVALGLLLLLGGFASITGLLALHALFWTIEVLVVWPRVGRLAPLALRVDRSELRVLAGQGAIIGLAASSAEFLFAGAVILLRHLVDDIGTVGTFGLALQLAMFVMMAVQGVLTAALARISRAEHEEDQRLRHWGGLVMLACLVLALPMYLGAQLLGPPVIAAIMGEPYRATGELLGPCLLLVLAVAMPGGFWQLLVLRNRAWIGFGAGIAGMIVLALAASPLVVAHGAAGIAYAALLGAGARALLLVVAGIASRPQKST